MFSFLCSICDAAFMSHGNENSRYGAHNTNHSFSLKWCLGTRQWGLIFRTMAEIITSSKTTDFHPASHYNSQVLKYDGRAGLSVLVSDILSHESLPSCERESSVKMLKRNYYEHFKCISSNHPHPSPCGFRQVSTGGKLS